MARGYTLTQTGSEVQEILNDEPTKQDELVSGENIKTINNQSILGPGNISVVPTTRTVNGKALSSNIILTAGDLNAYVKPDDGIPGSDLALGVIPDVSQFITKSVDDLVNYYLKTDTYTKNEVNSIIAAINQFHYEVYASTSEVIDPQNNVLYLIGPIGTGTDKYEEYVYTTTWVKIGDTSIDLSGYVTTTALNNALADYITTADLNTLLAGYQTKIDSNHKLDYSLLSNTPTIPDEQIQSDWEQTVTTAKDYIKNKPTIPSVVDSLSSASTTASLAANQGKILNESKVGNANVGYYECTTQSNAVAKTVTASGYVLNIGGCLHIKFSQRCYADNPTLNINSTGAKPLYYNGYLAGKFNTWNDGDVLSVYYDGTNYQCYNMNEDEPLAQFLRANGSLYEKGIDVQVIKCDTTLRRITVPLYNFKAGKTYTIKAETDSAVTGSSLYVSRSVFGDGTELPGVTIPVGSSEATNTITIASDQNNVCYNIYSGIWTGTLTLTITTDIAEGITWEKIGEYNYTTTANINKSFDISGYRNGTQFMLEVISIDSSGGKLGVTLKADGMNKTTLPIEKAGIYFLEKINADTLLFYKAGGLLNYRLYASKLFPIGLRSETAFKLANVDTVALGDPYRGYPRTDGSIYVDGAWIGFPIQYNRGYKIHVNIDFETYYLEFRYVNAGFRKSSTGLAFDGIRITEEKDIDLTQVYAWNLGYRRIDRATLDPATDGNKLTVTYVSGQRWDNLASVYELQKALDDFNPVITPDSRIAKPMFNGEQFFTKPFFYHFNPNGFINSGDDNIIASQSIPDIEIAARLGFDMIEANVQKTSDNHFICTHGESGKLGACFKSLVSGEDATQLTISSLSLSYIQTNIRYDSALAKYQTPPPTLEEFCEACKANGIGVFLGSNQQAAVEICRKYMGNNMIVYNPSSDIRTYYDGMVFLWSNSSTLTKATLISAGNTYGKPFSYGLGTNAIAALEAAGTLDDTIKEFHDNGWMISCTPVYDTAQNTNDNFARGFDFGGSGGNVNPFTPNYEVFDIDDVNSGITTTGTYSNGVISLASGQTITCGASNVLPLGKGMLVLKFNGSLRATFGSTSPVLTSDGSREMVVSSYFYQKDTTLTITASASTEVTGLVYKTSKC